MPSVTKCQAEKPADTNQAGGDFRRQPATFDNPDSVIHLLSKLLQLWRSYFLQECVYLGGGGEWEVVRFTSYSCMWILMEITKFQKPPK